MSFSYTLFKAKLIPVLPFLLAEAISIRNSKLKLPAIAENLTLGQNLESILVFGESTVAGVGASEPQFSLAGQFFQLFEQNLSVKNLGKNGLKVKNAIHLLQSNSFETYSPFVGSFIFLGANDCFNLTPPKTYRNHLEILLAHDLKNHKPNWIYLADIPPVHLFPAFSERMKRHLQIQRDYLRAEMRKIAEQDSKIIFDPIQLDLSSEFFAADGIHPSDLGYQKIAEFAWNGLKNRDLI